MPFQPISYIGKSQEFIVLLIRLVGSLKGLNKTKILAVFKVLTLFI
jgi:hypothetical protein